MAYAAYWMSLQGGAAASPLEVHHSSRSPASHSTAGSYYGKSQPSQATPKPAAQVSTAKPAQFEKAGSAMATKPGVVTTATGGVTRSGVTAGGSASVGTAGKAKPETNTTVAGATVIDMSSAGATFVDMTSTGARSGPKEMSKTAAVSQVKATATVPSPAAGVAATRPKESPKGTAKSATATTTFNTAVPKLDTAKTTKPISTAAAGNVSVQGKKEATQTKVQVEVPPAAAKGAKEVDPFDALASILPSADPITPLLPVYTGPEVTEHDITSERGQKCGERDSTLPPGYRFEDMPPAPADYKPKDVPKPLSTDEALDSLSFGFTPSTASAAPQKQEKSQTSSAAASVSVCAPAPPADKKAKMEKVSDDFSLESLLPAVTATATKAAPPVAVCQAPPADKKAKMMDANPKTDAGVSMSLDALSALVDTLPEDKPKPELPKLRPEDIVSEDKHKKETGVFVGERDDSIAPEYRFNVDELKKLPAPKPEPTIGTGEALDFLSGDFTDSSAAPVVQAPSAQKHEDTLIVCYGPPPAVMASVITPVPLPTQTKVEDLSALDLLSGDFVSSTKTSGLQAPVPPPTKKTPEKTVCPLEQHRPVDVLHGRTPQAKPNQGGSLSLDALSALSDTLPEDKPKPELPKLRPEDIVSEDKHKKKKGVFVGERDDSIAPEYRFNEEQLKKLPAPEPEPTMCTGDALDILSGGFESSSAPVVQAPVITPSAPPAQSSADFSLDALAGEFVSSSAAPTVKSAVCVPTETAAELYPGADNAMDALSDTLKDITPAPQPVPPPAKDIVKEKKVVEERLVKMGERDDSLPPEYRPTKEMGEAPAPPKGKTMDDKTAMDLLSSDFGAAASKPAAPAASSAATTKLEPPVLDSKPLKPMTGAVLDSLSSTLLPDVPEFKPTDKPKGKSKSKSKSKKHQAEEPSPTEQLPAQQSSDVVPRSTKKEGKR
ncbi:calpastatin isoform X21 [Cottoperca gobio]|uniref:Calpastatin n=1 Tax=Cottoperca gobio TaxID=56716 RepID=A0A6J2PL52_COTGO|nr:calpastatin isoform X21 [Cottoperca gobio]